MRYLEGEEGWLNPRCSCSKVDKSTLALHCIIVCTLQPSNESGEPSCRFSSTSKEKKKYESKSDKNMMDIRSHSFHSFSDKSLMYMHHLQLTSKSNLPLVFTESQKKYYQQNLLTFWILSCTQLLFPDIKLF